MPEVKDLVESTTGQEITFHVCLLQVLQNRTENMSTFSQFYMQDVKKKGNMFMQAIDKRLDGIYGVCDKNEINQGMNLINLIEDKMQEAWEEYLKDQQNGEI